MLRVLEQPDTRRSLLLVAGLGFGAALAFALAGTWYGGAVGIGFTIAALGGLAQRCSA